MGSGAASAAALGTGCYIQYPTTGAKLSHTDGATTFGDAAADIDVNTGLTSVKRAWLEVLGGTVAYVSATSGATITCHPTATAGTYWWFADGYV